MREHAEKRARTWVEFGPALLELDEVYSLAGTMEISQVEAAGYIALVVAYGLCKAEDDGQINDLTDRAIEKACYWMGERGALIAAFIQSGVFYGERDNDDDPLRISPRLWDELAGDTMKKRLQERKRKQQERERSKNKNS